MFLSLIDLLRQQGGALSADTAPVVEVRDQGTNLVVRAVLKGIDPKSVQVQLTESGLAIGGRRTVEERTESPQSYRFSLSVSQFYRELRLPSRVKPRAAVARWEAGGLLEITLPKA
ncbi:MAG TPA: Hsp20/alpha crystallin family protein [Symbiobacteriaceae bacterium]|nr:Hsp20/alpha crystallin family protein [Symbiobacteriaceae bacterium]